jgi:glutaredoxin
MRCEEHGLAAGPGGECVVCLREARARDQRRLLRLSVGFAASVLVVCGAVLASRALRAPAIVPHAERTGTVAPTPVPTIGSVPQAASLHEQPREPAAAPAAANEPANDGAPSSAAPPAAPLAAAEPPPIAHVPTHEDVQAAYHATPVLMFSTTWCPHCNRARKFFQANGLRYVDRDIDSDASANAELKRRTGHTAIPLIEVDGQQLEPGFDEQATMQAIAASVQRRLGVVTSVRLVPASAPN